MEKFIKLGKTYDNATKAIEAIETKYILTSADKSKISDLYVYNN